MSKRIAATLTALLSISGMSCSSDDPLDAENAPFPTGKSDGGIDEGSPEALAVLALVNDPQVNFSELDDKARLHKTAAANIILYREGADGIDGSSDDEVFDDLKELDDIPYVGSTALQRLLDYATEKGLLDTDGPDPKYDYDIRVRSVWTEVSGTPGKQFLSILGDDAYTFDNHIAIYGEKNGGLSVRDFEGPWWSTPFPGNKLNSKDHWYTIEGEVISATEMKVKLTGKNGTTFDLVYHLQTMTDELEKAATTAVNKHYTKYDELRDSDIETLSDLKGHIALHLRTHGYDPNDHWDAYEYQLEEFWLQIEAEFGINGRESSLADVEIKADGSDAISQHYLAANGATEFTDDNDLPDPEVLLDNWDWLSNDDPEFFQVVPGVGGLTDGPIKKGMEKFVTHTFMRLNAFECSDGYEYIPDFTWYLKDGTIVNYWVGVECD